METINLHEAKTHLSRLVARAARGESFIIARNGQPLVKVVPLSPLPDEPVLERLGFLEGEVHIPDDFDEMGRDEIAQAFGTAD